VKREVEDFKSFDFERPPFLDPERMDRAIYIPPTPAFGGLSAGFYQNASAEIGVSDESEAAPVYQIPVMLRGVPSKAAWRDGHFLALPNFPAGATTCFDMRHRWSVELQYAFKSLHFYVPQSAFDDFTRELGQPSVDRLRLSPTEVTADPIVYHLAQATAALMESPSPMQGLLSDQILCALRTHLAFSYGGVKLPARRPAELSQRQIQRLRSLMLDDLERNVRLEELARTCELPVTELRRCFKNEFGLPPHQWRLARKVERARGLIEFTDKPLAQIAFESGFSDQSHLTRIFTRQMGVPPAAYRRARRG
jgi:AraC-like DNA-binding protein